MSEEILVSDCKLATINEDKSESEDNAEEQHDVEEEENKTEDTEETSSQSNICNAESTDYCTQSSQAKDTVNINIGTEGYTFTPYIETSTDNTRKCYQRIQKNYYQHIGIGHSKYETKSNQELRFEDEFREIAVDNHIEEETKTEREDKEDKEDKNDCLDGDESECETKEDEHKLYRIIIEGTEDNFYSSDLKNIEYFRNYFSSRWLNNKNKESIEIPVCNDKVFEISELKVIIHYKKYEMIDNQYDISRIKYLIDALDYFTEIIDNKTFYQYLLNHVPMIKMNEIEEIMNSMNGYDENKCFLQFEIAVIDYKEKKTKIRLQTKNKFVTEWDKIAIDVIVKMKHISYEILMNTMKLIKVNETQSNQCKFDRWDRDCQIDIEFLHKRSIDDLNKIWADIVNTGNTQYLLDILSTLTLSFSNREKLTYWTNYSRIGNLYHNKYKVVEYKHNVSSINKQMIIHVFEVLLNEESIASYNVLNDIMTMYTKSIDEQTDIDKFYGDIINAYFETHHVFHGSFVIIFNFRKKILADKFQKLSDDIKNEFLQSIFTLTTSKNSKNKNDEMIEIIIKFFMENNKKEAIEFILKHHQSTFIIEFVNLFKQILEENNDENSLSELYSIMIDNHLTDSSNFHPSDFMISCECFSNIEILNRFAIITENQKINFLYILFTSNISGIPSFAQKRKEIGSVLLKHNICAAKETFGAWFKTLMLDEKEWIITGLLSTDNVSLNFLEKVLNTICELLLTEKQELIPQEYFDFVDQHTY